MQLELYRPPYPSLWMSHASPGATALPFQAGAERPITQPYRACRQLIKCGGLGVAAISLDCAIWQVQLANSDQLSYDRLCWPVHRYLIISSRPLGVVYSPTSLYASGA